MDRIARRFAHRFLIATSVSALILCPHSKVEESFPLQATFDLYYRTADNWIPWLSHWSVHEFDHLQFPGVVPRSFVGPLLLASLCRIVTMVLRPFYDLPEHPLLVQLLARGLLLGLVMHGWFRFANALDKNDKADPSWKGTYLLIVTAVQFHMPFYASRMLPNTFALWLILHAYADWAQGRIKRAAMCLVVTTAVFRCDVLLLLFTVGLGWLFQRQLTIVEALRVGIVTGMVCLLVTIPIDSYLWQTYWIWPEGQVFYFNTILGKSSDWGTSPWHWYLSSALPKALLLTGMLVPIGVLRIPEQIVAFFQRRPRSLSNLIDTSLLPYLIPIAGFVGLYSCLGHKEMRFIFPAMPVFNMAAAAGLERLHRLAFIPYKDKPPSSKLALVLWLGGISLCLISLLASFAFVGVSRHNYPGGTALQILLSERANDLSERTNVHVDVAAAMTGVSLFGQRAAGPHWTFVKAGYEAENKAGGDFTNFTYLLSENKDVEGFHVLATASGNPRLNWRRGRIDTADGIYVLERDN